MAADIFEHRDSWTWVDLEEIKGHERRFEIQDGNLVVSPSPSLAHQVAESRLVHALIPIVGPDHLVVPEMDLVLAETSVRIPDVLVVRRSQTAAAGQSRLAPRDVALAVEIVSPSSRRTDRLVKPLEYAEAGIAGFWRVELDPEIRLTAYALADGEYVELGSRGPGETAVIAEPLALTIAIDDLAPPA